MGEAVGPGGGTDLERTGAAGGQAAQGLLATLLGDQRAEGRAGLWRGAGDGRPGFVDLQDRPLERIGALDQGGAERRGGGEGVETAGLPEPARIRCGDWGRRDRFGRGQPQQEGLAGQGGRFQPPLHPANGDALLGPAVALGGAQQGIGAFQGVALQALVSAEQFPPGSVEALDRPVGADDSGRLGQRAGQGVEVRRGQSRSGDAAPGDQGDHRQRRQSRQQQQAGQRRGSRAERRGGGQDDGDDEEPHRQPGDQTEAARGRPGRQGQTIGHRP